MTDNRAVRRSSRTRLLVSLMSAAKQECLLYFRCAYYILQEHLPIRPSDSYHGSVGCADGAASPFIGSSLDLSALEEAM
jgi:hypothetical protein